MRKRTGRGWLVLGAVGLLASAACPAEAGTTGEAEGGVYGGTGAGSWACGLSNAKVKYGGGGVRGRVWLGQPERAPGVGEKRAPEGFSVGGGVSAEMRKYTLTGCHPEVDPNERLKNKPCSSDFFPLPSDGLYAGGVLFVGYDHRWVGGRIGALGYQRSRDPSLEDQELRAPKKLQLWPELNVRVGPRTGLHGEVGTGSYSVDNVMRPAVLYAGLIWPATDRVELAFRVGQHEIFDSGEKQARADLSARLSVSELLRLGLGGGIHDGQGGIHPHGRLLLGAAF